MPHPTHPPPAPGTPTTLLSAFFAREPAPPRHKARGQGLVEYGLALVLIALVVIGALTVLGGSVGETFFKISCGVDGEELVYSKKENGSKWRQTDRNGQAKIIGCVGEDAAGDPIMRGWRRAQRAEEQFGYPPNIQGGDASLD